MKCMPKILDDLIIDIAKLPGIGKKTAERLADIITSYLSFLILVVLLQCSLKPLS